MAIRTRLVVSSSSSSSKTLRVEVPASAVLDVGPESPGRFTVRVGSDSGPSCRCVCTVQLELRSSRGLEGEGGIVFQLLGTF